MPPEHANPLSHSAPAADTDMLPEERGAAGNSGWREIDALANAVRALHHQENRGDLAALRRMKTESPTEPAFHRILAGTALNASFEHARRLALLTKILALATSLETLRNGGQNLGRGAACRRRQRGARPDADDRARQCPR